MNEQVLIIDDQIDSIEAIKDALELRDISCRGETDPTKAIEDFHSNPTDLVIVDFVLTPNNVGITGLNVITKLKEIKPYTRFILISGFIPVSMDDDNASEKLAEIAKVEYLPKPIIPSKLVELVMDLLRDTEDEADDWVNIAKNYVGDNKIRIEEVRALNEEIKNSILENLRRERTDE